MSRLAALLPAGKLSAGKLHEWAAGRAARGQILFTGTRRRMTSVTVRGDQMAAEMDGVCLRSRFLTDESVKASPAVVWIVEADLDRVARYKSWSPQFLDVVNPAYEQDRGRFAPQYRAFRYLILNTASSLSYMGQEPADGWRSWVIPHHHCNQTGWQLPEERIERPKVVGYIGEPVHLHDHDAIRDTVESLGMELRCFGASELDAYRQFDLGIAWTRRDPQRDDTRSNIKLTNFAAHGIPSVVCDYESYRDVDRALGGVCLIRPSLNGFLEGVRILATDSELRRSLAAKGPLAAERYSRKAVADQYRGAIRDARGESPFK